MGCFNVKIAVGYVAVSSIRVFTCLSRLLLSLFRVVMSTENSASVTCSPAMLSVPFTAEVRPTPSVLCATITSFTR